MNVRIQTRDSILLVTVCRPAVRNAIDRETADQLAAAFRRFEADSGLDVAVLTGAGGHFCAGADLKALATGEGNRLDADGDGPLGPTRMRLSKPVIAAVEGYAVAGGLELALWCDLRVASESAVFGVFCRRFGVPLVDGGTVRLPRIIGHGRALDMILTGRPVDAKEALSIGLVNRVVPVGGARDAALELAGALGKLPQSCLRNDRRSVYEQWGLDSIEAMENEFRLGMRTISSGETGRGAARFLAGDGRSGSTVDRSPEDRGEAD